MSTFTRAALGGLAVTGAILLSLTLWRGEPGTLIGDAYAFVAGAPARPVPLARPPHLALAALGECLRGTGHVEGDNAYAAYCSDLASLGSVPHITAPPERDTARLHCAPFHMEGLAPVDPGCLVPSPAGGTVLYAGIFKGYFGVVIIETERGRMTLAGLGEVKAERGARIAKGEAVGTAPAATAPALTGAASGHGPYLLYMEGDAVQGPAA